MSQPESLPKPADSVGQPIEDPAKRAEQRATHAFWQDAYSQQMPKGAVVDASVKHPSDALPIAMPWNASGMPITDYKIVFGDASKFGLTWNDEKHKGLATGFTEASIGKGRALKAKVDA